MKIHTFNNQISESKKLKLVMSTAYTFFLDSAEWGLIWVKEREGGRGSNTVIEDGLNFKIISKVIHEPRMKDGQSTLMGFYFLHVQMRDNMCIM